MRTYQEIEDNLKEVVNMDYSHNIGFLFKELIKELKNNYHTAITLQYIKNLINIRDKKYKSNRVYYLLEQSGLTIEQHGEIFKEWKFDKYQREVIIYKNNPNKKVYNNKFDFENDNLSSIDTILFNDGYSKQELKLLSDDSKKEIAKQIKQNIRNAINKTGKPFIKAVNKVNVGKAYICNGGKIYNVIAI